MMPSPAPPSAASSPDPASSLSFAYQADAQRVKDPLIVDFAEHAAGTTGPAGRPRDRSWTSAEFDIVLAPAPAQP